MQHLNGGQALIAALRTEGIQEVFGIVGGKLAPLLQALAAEPAMRFHGVRHEAAGAMMAAAVHGSGLGRIAVAMGEMGPGGLNLAAGLGPAFANHLPLLVLTTGQHRAAARPFRGMFMDLDTHALLKPLVKWSAVVQDGRRIPELVRRAFREALSGRPGPVHLDVPQDVLTDVQGFDDGEFTLPPARYRPLHGPRPAAADVTAGATLLAGAQRPLIVAGGGVLQADAVAAVRALAARLQAPVLPTQMALGVVPTDSPHFIGQGGVIGGEAVAAAMAQADVVLAVGCRFSSWMWDERGPLVRRHQAVVNINIDPSALGEPVCHQVAMHADARQALDDLLAALPPTSPGADAAWLAGLRQQRLRHEANLLALADAPGEVMHPAALARAIGRAMPAEALAVYDGGHTSFWSNDLTPVTAPHTRFHEPGMSQLGFGLPQAIALQLLHPGRPVFNLTGDGSFGFTLQELDTARRLKAPVISVIHHNASWGVIRIGQQRQGFDIGTTLEDTDHAAIARGFGCYGETVSRPDEVAPAIARALASGLPAVIDCLTRFEPHPCMPAFGSLNRYGFGALVGNDER